MRIAEFQKLIRDRYHASDSARGVPGTFLWLAEEIGELASALADAERGKKDEENLAEAAATDVLDLREGCGESCVVCRQRRGPRRRHEYFFEPPQ